MSITRSTVVYAAWLLLLLCCAALPSSSHAQSTGGAGPDDSSSESTWEDLLCAIALALSSALLLLVLFRIYRLRRDAASEGLTPGGSAVGDSSGLPGSKAGAPGESDETTKRNWKIEFADLELGALIGQGSIGRVFQGKWRGLTVAVKEVIHSARESELIDELSLLIRVRHPNLCLFMGLAMPTPEKLYLVSEHMARGNLYTVLHDKNQKLDWKRRLTMALDAARAMNYLHCCAPPVLHKNLNSINLLVDKELVTKVCDYAVDTIRKSAKKSGVYTQPLWVAPELFKKAKPTKAADVYSFGIVLYRTHA